MELDESTRSGAACLALRVAELAEVGWLPEHLALSEALRRAVEFAGPEQPFSRLELAWLETDLVEALFQESRFDEGLARVARAEMRYADVPEALAEILLLGANAQEYLGRYAQSLALASGSRKLLETLPADARPSAHAVPFSLAVQAKILIHIGVPDQAAPLLRNARDEARASGCEECESMLLDAESELAQARGDWEWIVEHVGEAVARGSVPGDHPEDRPRRELVLRQAEAMLALQTGRRLEETRRELAAAIEGIGLEVPGTWYAALTLCDLDLALDDPARAEQMASAVTERIAASGAIPALVVRSNLAGVRGRIALRDPPDDDGLARRTADAEVALNDLLAAWDSVPPRDGGVGFLHFDERRSLLVTWMRLLGSTTAVHEARSIEMLLDVERRGSLARRLQPRAPSLERVRHDLVPARGGILVFLPSAWGSLAFTLDAHGLRAWPLPGSDAWADIDDRLALEMHPQSARDAGASKRTQELAAALRDVILSPELDAHIGAWESIVLVRTENMGSIHFEALPLRSRGGAPLGLELATSYLPSLSVGLGLLDRRAAREARAAGSADGRILLAVGPTRERPRDDETWQPIPWNDEDSRRLSAPWPRGVVTVELDPDRALDRLLRAGQDGFEIVEVVAHGVRDAEIEQGQGFFFRRDEPVFPPALFQMQAAPTTLLLVCDASAGATRQGDDLGSHLTAAFLASGSDVVAGSRTDVSFGAAVALIEEFHVQLARGALPAPALLAARRRLSASEEWSHPAFHSSLTLTGLGFVAATGWSAADDGSPAPDVDARRAASWMVYALIALSCAGLCAAALRRRRVP